MCLTGWYARSPSIVEEASLLNFVVVFLINSSRIRRRIFRNEFIIQKGPCIIFSCVSRKNVIEIQFLMMKQA